MSSGIVAVSFEHDAAECIEDILENIAKIESYVAGLSREMFEGDDRTRDAAERCLERICEAVFRLGARVEQLMPAQPAGAILGMGNRLRHAYDNVDLALVWGTIRDDLPTLKADAERALGILRTTKA
jgi:uncharacterized protein with HEPN domain